MPQSLSLSKRLLASVYLKLTTTRNEVADLDPLKSGKFCELVFADIRENSDLYGEIAGTSRSFSTKLSSYRASINYSGNTNRNKVFENPNSPLVKMLVKYCGYDNLSDFDKRSPKIETTKFIEILKILNISHENSDNSVFSILSAKEYFDSEDTYEIPDSFFEVLEFEKNNVLVNCISHSLKWAATYLIKKEKAILQKNNEYRYILTDSRENRHLYDFNSYLENSPLKDKVTIKRLYKSETFKLIRRGGIILPISNDIVLYQWEIGNEANHKELGILGTRPDAKNIGKGYSLKISHDRTLELINWFNEVWKELP